MATLREAALHGIDIVHLPNMAVSRDIRDGTLVDVLPGWAPPTVVV